jgi:hypothetical protein
MVEEVGPEHLRYCENPLGVGDVLKNFALEELGENRCPLGAAGGTESAALAGESDDEELEAALGTNDSGEAGFEESTIHEREDRRFPVSLPETVASLESLFPQALEGLEVGLEELEEGALAGIAGPVTGRAGEGLRRQGGVGGAAHAV